MIPPSVLHALVWISLLSAVAPALLFCWNLFLYRAPRRLGRGLRLAPVSVLIPARDEERSIAAAVRCVLASTDVEVEVVVLDDASSDRTAEVVRAIAAVDSRVRLERAPPLPPGWNGKQHACWVLSSLAHHQVLCFLDADVRVAPSAIARMSGFLVESRSQLVSGFPRQETVTAMEWLLLPLIHILLLGFLPLEMMRRSKSPAFAAGCGQFLLVNRGAYESSGTHAAIRATMHDGILLPALLRRHRQRTDLADLTSLATCRMYRNAGEVWRGLAKNATEGIATPARILPFTILLFFGQVAPVFLLAMARQHRAALALAGVALFASLLPRALALWRFRQSFAGALLHPLAVFLLLVLQWYALIRKWRGKNVAWKQRVYESG